MLDDKYNSSSNMAGKYKKSILCCYRVHFRKNLHADILVLSLKFCFMKTSPFSLENCEHQNPKI